MANLTPEQKQTVIQWIQSGSGLADVQKRLREELGVSLTYMDVRLLVLELGVNVKDKAKPSVADVSGKKTADPGMKTQQDDPWGDDDEGEAGAAGTAGLGAGRVSVSLDRILKPGTVISGTVTFSDGATLGWGLDQFGRLGLSGGKPGYKPAQQDLVAFQAELRRLLEQKGF